MAFHPESNRSDFRQIVANSASDTDLSVLCSTAQRIGSLALQADDLALQFETLSERIFGSSPDEGRAEKGGPVPVPNGVLQGIDDALSSLSGKLNRIHAASERLNRLA